MNHDVFISYSSKNPAAAQAICHELEDNGIKCWMAPRDITPGKKYGDLIDDAILTCRVFLLVYSADSLSSQWCNGELNVAFTEGKTIIPYRIDATPLKGAMRVILNQTHWIDAYPNYKTRFKDLVTVVGQSLGKTIPSTPHTPAPTPQPTPNRFKKFWWIALCVVVVGVFGWVWSNREPADYADTIETSETSVPEIIAEEIKSDDSDANAELEELRATQERLEKENNELKHNNEELENNNKDLQKDIDNIKAKEEAERQAKLQAEKKAKEEAEKSAKLQIEKKTKQNTPQTQTAQKVEIKEAEKDNSYLLSLPDSEFVTYKDVNNKYGFKLKSTGEIVILAKYYFCSSFNGELSSVQLEEGGYLGFINKKGEEVTQFKYTESFVCTDDRIMVASSDWKYGFIDKTGKEVIPLNYYIADGFSEGLARVKLDDKGWGYIDKTGKEVIPLMYDEAKSFYEGLASVKLDDKGWGYIDKTGKEIIPLMYDDASGFSEDLARVKLDDKGWGYIDKTGKEVIPLMYDDARGFNKGLARVKLDDKGWGYIDKTGKEVIPMKYDVAGDFSEGLASVTLKGKGWGFIDKTGKEVIPLKYSYTLNFKGGKVLVNLNGEEFYIDKNGNRIE